MIEQYLYNRITEDTTLQGFLSDGAGGYKLYPGVVPRGNDITNAVTFTTIVTNDVYPKALSVTVQFSVFSKTHADSVLITRALANLFNEDNRQSDAGVDVVFSIRKSESDLGFDYDDNLYQREATYYFKLR